MISCKKATYLVSKQEENKLTIRERVQLAIHMKACNLCRMFRLQTKWLSGQMKHSAHHDEIKLSEEKKQALRDLFKNQ